MPRSQSPSRSLTQSKPVLAATPASKSSTVTHKVEQPGFFSNMIQGFGLGAGQSLAFNLFRSDPVVKHVHVGPSQEYTKCMEEKNDAAECKQYLDTPK